MIRHGRDKAVPCFYRFSEQPRYLCTMITLPDLPIFKTVSEAARELGVEAYVVGGYVRDLVLGRDARQGAPDSGAASRGARPRWLRRPARDDPVADRHHHRDIGSVTNYCLRPILT